MWCSERRERGGQRLLLRSPSKVTHIAGEVTPRSVTTCGLQGRSLLLADVLVGEWTLEGYERGGVNLEAKTEKSKG